MPLPEQDRYHLVTIHHGKEGKEPKNGVGENERYGISSMFAFEQASIKAALSTTRRALEGLHLGSQELSLCIRVPGLDQVHGRLQTRLRQATRNTLSGR